MADPRYVIVRVAHPDVVRLSVTHQFADGVRGIAHTEHPVPPDDRLGRDVEWAIDLAAHLLLHDENQDEPITGLERLRRLRAAFGLDEGSDDDGL